MNKILDVILTNTYSISQLKHRLSLLKNHLLKTLFASKQELILTESESNWLNSLPKDFLSQFNQNNIYKIFEDLEKQITSLKPLIIYLTFEPDDDTLSQIGEKTRQVFGSPRSAGGAGRVILLDIKYNPALIAGASFVWNGLSRDYSLKAKVEERKMVILDSFKKFLR